MAVLRHNPSISELAVEALGNYFKPWSYVADLGSGRFASRLAKDVARISKIDRNAMALTRKAVCFNQGGFLQYSFLAAEKHRKLKDLFRDNPDDIKTLQIYASDLTDHVNKILYEVCYKNFLLLHAYFASTGRSAPRICVKGSFKVHGTDRVVTVFRDSAVSYDSSTLVENNTGFEAVRNTGTYFLENDLPRAYFKGKYKNPRLSAYDQSSLKDLGLVRKNWRDIWDHGKEAIDRSSTYQSTMIVPMTLWNNELSEEFKELVNLDDVDRTIFGFLCFDHEETDYFDEDSDVSVGYVIADIISMYLFSRLVYVDISKTYQNVAKHLTAAGINLASDRVESVWKKLPKNIDFKDYLECVYKKSKDNKLISIDEDLLRFVHPADLADR